MTISKGSPKRKIYSLILTLLFLGLSITGTECENLLLGSGDIDGSWTLVSMQGDLQDVCLGEQATFNTTTGIATLKCPNSTTVTRSFDYGNGMLIFTETGIKYSVSFQTTPDFTSQLVLDGQNVDRKLFYNRISN
ncbi:MAG: hypothetical protein OZ913_09740 [Ignavibacteriaceae bacterium]|jgi:hypothetical protein|nr:MAG: hypothetical protein EDM69_10240 [Chlorobiota bacterium]KXK02271.1 MAG: hypothetical protein UZ04_CHB001002065 [Chlorobi bacterium OLB4]MBV6399698.1 hypothetical protein [Ignavibacteria bacterium]MCC6885621.1 hypothetical protein [Ignavibacteriales bacterium]MCE7953999.1 hypothetical protein [Chlorobi bacterium CHB7]MDL1887898.1 hypothetical protein [Ignavibacteria bacterium CHB1]MEB2330563.1 hypothetical protein [Ignavibacteriaceae bacterium]OQY78793.1 MAG: hypothetical protein B6D4